MNTAEYPCPGDCNRDFRKAEQASEDHDTDFVPGQPVWCPLCRDLIERDLADLHGLAMLLHPGKLNTPREVSTNDSSHQRRSASPSGSPGWDTADAIIRWAVQLEDTTRARLGHGDPKPGRRMLADSLRYLEAWSTSILSDTANLDSNHHGPTCGVRCDHPSCRQIARGGTPEGERVGQQIRRHKRDLVRVTGTDRLTHRIKGQCPRQKCGARGRLARADGTELVKCGACGAMWAWDYFQHLARAIVDTEKAS